MPNLLTLEQFRKEEIFSLLQEAQAYRQGASLPNFTGKIACNLFFESSTRTQYSFTVAQERLGMRVLSFHPENSSLNKEESFYDTVKTFDSLGVDALVIRHCDNEYYNSLIGKIHAPILNGGDGTGNHPTQSLLDLLTIAQEFSSFDGLKVAIVGDIKHSRVAHTDYWAMKQLGMHPVIAGPKEYLGEEGYNIEDFDHAVATSDVVMMLRVQFERHGLSENFTKQEYHQLYGLTEKRVATMKEDAIIMHPAPVNRGVEIADSVVEHPKSRIFTQMKNGVFVRMAALRHAMEGGFRYAYIKPEDRY
ncbi:MAG: aspartate carbamoyltransferase catalytic subunit [Clostridiales bacterium]|nr:aspartate carbamoyltransferase catalytic subunit [Clostridiales bacterium]